MWRLVHDAKPSVVALDLRAVPDLEYTALMALVEARRQLQSAGIALWLVAMTPKVFAVVKRSPLGADLAGGRAFPKLAQAVEAYTRGDVMAVRP
jgi:anti-anti-sigma regulatory factor